ncbi:LuxR C-terminal-related transcriptional regulator [Phaeobacter sp. A36a-5a]|uniref:helix-turn-helix transcriptional regulator n=1 Tax=Phaeobacter bryozoorum TaxID=1086632 RepID=UPI0030C93AD0
MDWTDIDSLERCTSIAELWAQSLQVFAAMGFDYAIYLTVDGDRSHPHIQTNLPDIYQQLPSHRDPFLDHCCNSYEPQFTGAEFLADHPYLAAAETAFIRDASVMSGFRAGIAIPVRLQGSDRFGGFNIGTSLTRADFLAHVAGKTDSLRFLCMFIHRRMEELRQPAAAAPEQPPADAPAEAAFNRSLIAPQSEALTRLSPREREVLYLFSQGLTTKECAAICKISPHTVSEYANSIYRKLNVRNRVEAIGVLARIRPSARPGR